MGKTGHNDNVMTYWEGCILYHCPVLVNVRDLVTVAGVSSTGRLQQYPLYHPPIPFIKNWQQCGIIPPAF